MRLLAGTAILLGLSAATDAAAQMRPGAQAAAFSDAAFAPTALATRDDPIGALLERTTAGGGDSLQWRINLVRLAPARSSGPVDSLRITTGDAVFGPGGLPLSRDRADVDNEAYEIALVRDWPGAVNLDAGKFSLDLSPHAGVGVGTLGGSAEAGATLRLGKRVDDVVADRLKEMGVRDGARFGDTGRWYLFAAASGRAVGMNVARSGDGWNGRGWSTDPAAATIADAQVGVGWRSGAMQTAFGYIRREVKSDYKVWGQETKAASLVALTFSIKPGN